MNTGGAFSTIAHDRIGNNAHREARDIELFYPLLSSFLFFFLFLFLAVRSELSSIFSLPFFQIVNRLVSREEKTRICDNEVATDRPKNLIPRLVYLARVHAITSRYIFLHTILSGTIYCHLVGKIVCRSKKRSAR